MVAISQEFRNKNRETKVRTNDCAQQTGNVEQLIFLFQTHLVFLLAISSVEEILQKKLIII